jgi:hypothetical protein
MRSLLRIDKSRPTDSEPETPLNTTFEDSIHMPQNHKHNRQPKGPNLPPHHVAGHNLQSSAPPIPPIVPNRPERSRDHLSTPMWDDASGAIYNLPSRPRLPDQVCSSQNQRSTIEFEESIAPIPRGLNETSGYNPNPRRIDGARRPPPLIRDWRPIRDEPTERSSRATRATGQVPANRQALGKKDENKKLGQATPLPAQAKVPYSKIRERSAQLPVSPRYDSKVQAPFKTPPTQPEAMCPASDLADDASPLTVFKKRSSTDARPSSPTLERVRKMRCEEQEKVKRPSRVVFEKKDIQSLSGAASKRQMKGESAELQELIPEIELSISDWSTPLYGLSKAPNKEEPVSLDAAKQARFAEDSAVAQDNEVLSLSEALTDLQVFQQVFSSPPAERGLVRKSVVPEPLVAKAVESPKVANFETLVAMPKHVARSHQNDGKPMQVDDECGRVSKVSASEEEFERVATPDSGEVDQNGVRRKWYKGFRR